MRYSIGLFTVLAAFWLINSPNDSVLLLLLGLVSICFVIVLIHRMRLLDSESLPLHLLLRILPFYCWLFVEIIKGSAYVLARIAFPRSAVKPEIFSLQVTFSKPMTAVIFANSVTLVPGTLCIQLEDNEVTIHALSESLARELKQGALIEKLVQLESA